MLQHILVFCLTTQPIVLHNIAPLRYKCVGCETSGHVPTCVIASELLSLLQSHIQCRFSPLLEIPDLTNSEYLQTTLSCQFPDVGNVIPTPLLYLHV